MWFSEVIRLSAFRNTSRSIFWSHSISILNSPENSDSRCISQTGLRIFRGVHVVHECICTADVFHGAVTLFDGGMPDAADDHGSLSLAGKIINGFERAFHAKKSFLDTR